MTKMLGFCKAILLSAIFFMTPSPLVFAGQVEKDLISLLNQDRKINGRRPLSVSPKLMAAAEKHARDMAKRRYFSHKGRDGSTVGTRVNREGYKYCYVAENIARGQKTARQTMGSWRNSSGHNKNNLSLKATHVGAGVAGGTVWVLVFASPCS